MIHVDITLFSPITHSLDPGLHMNYTSRVYRLRFCLFDEYLHVPMTSLGNMQPGYIFESKNTHCTMTREEEKNNRLVSA